MRGQKYYLKYNNWHHDPVPYLFVTHWDRNYTKGFNLHYLPNIRFKIPIDSYRRVNEDKWAAAYENVKSIGLYKKFIIDLEMASQRKLSMSAWDIYTVYLARKYKFCMEAYRVYHTPLLVPRPGYPAGVKKE